MQTNKLAFKGNKYFLQAYQGLSFQHGGTGNLDIESILQEEQFQPVVLPQVPTVFLYLKRWLVMQDFVRKISPNDLLFCQFPVYPRMFRILVRKLSKKGVPLATLVADIDGLKDGNPALLKKEIQQLAQFTYFIVHNQSMENWIRSVIPHAIIRQLGPFDFLAEPISQERSRFDGINFSGNLQKSSFIPSLKEISNIQFHLYGAGIDTQVSLAPNLHYHGVFNPAELPRDIKGSFGLVWDGDSIHGAAGSLGHYMQFINHHKLSLYILAGMPVIVPSFAGSAQYVLDNGIGWVVNDLVEIPRLLDNINDVEFQAAKNNMVPIAREISKGNHLRNALKYLFSS